MNTIAELYNVGQETQFISSGTSCWEHLFHALSAGNNQNEDQP